MTNFTQNNGHLAIFRWLLLSFFCLTNFSAAQSVITQNEGEEVTCVDFDEDYDSLELLLEVVANSGGKTLMILLYDNHFPDKKEELTKRVFTDQRVIELSAEKMIPVGGNIRKAFGNKLKAQYGINQIPAILFIGPGGKLLSNSVEGDVTAEKILHIFDDVILVRDDMPDTASTETIEFLNAQTQFTSGERSAEFLRNYVRQCKKFSGEDWCSPLSEFYRVVPAVSLGSDENMAFTLEFADKYQSAAYNELVKKLPFYIAKFTERTVSDKIRDAYTIEVMEIIRKTKQGDIIGHPTFEELLATSNKLALPEKTKAMLRFEMRSLYYMGAQKIEEYLKSAIQYLDVEGGLELISINELNDIAWSFAVHATQKQDFDKALAWSTKIKAKAVHQPAYYETYAALLYRKNEIKKSLSVLKTAKEIARSSGKNYRSILHLEQIVVQNLPLPNKQEALDD
mgnify:CR=1 FL=1